MKRNNLLLLILFAMSGLLLWTQAIPRTAPLKPVDREIRAECLAAMLGKQPRSTWQTTARADASDKTICVAAVTRYHGQELVGGPHWVERLNYARRHIL